MNYQNDKFHCYVKSLKSLSFNQILILFRNIGQTLNNKTDRLRLSIDKFHKDFDSNHNYSLIK